AKRVLKEPTPMYKVAERWKNRILRAREQAPRLDYYLELRYEDVVLDTEASLRRICEYVELPWDDSMLHYHERAAKRMKEMHRDLPPEPGKPLRPADHRTASHALTAPPPAPRARRKGEKKAAPPTAPQAGHAAPPRRSPHGRPRLDLRAARPEPA